MPEKGWTFMYQVNAHTLIIWTVGALSADAMTFAATLPSAETVSQPAAPPLFSCSPLTKSILNSNP